MGGFAVVLCGCPRRVTFLPVNEWRIHTVRERTTEISQLRSRANLTRFTARIRNRQRQLILCLITVNFRGRAGRSRERAVARRAIDDSRWERWLSACPRLGRRFRDRVYAMRRVVDDAQRALVTHFSCLHLAGLFACSRRYVSDGRPVDVGRSGSSRWVGDRRQGCLEGPK